MLRPTVFVPSRTEVVGRLDRPSATLIGWREDPSLLARHNFVVHDFANGCNIRSGQRKRKEGLLLRTLKQECTGSLRKSFVVKGQIARY